MSDTNSTAASASAAAAAAAAAAASASEAAYEDYLLDIYYKYSWLYPHDLYYIFASVAFWAGAVNIFSLWWAWRRRHLLRKGALIQAQRGVDADTEKASAQPQGKSEWRNLPAAILAGSRIVGLRWRIPHVGMTMVELVLTVGFMVAVFVLTFINTAKLDISEVESRAADLATAQFPLIFALSTKNNVIVFLTGISHEKLNLTHRILSRISLIGIWIHWWGCVAEGVDMWGETWVWMGTMSAIAQSVVTITSVKWMRKNWYEFFFLCHVIFVFIFLLGALWHCIGLGDGDYWHLWVWSCVAIWGFDRLCRYLRYLILSSFHAPNKNPAHVELLSEDTLCITTRRTFSLPMRIGDSWTTSKGWQAGQHMFVAFPTIGPIESHPFTIASVCEPVEGDATGRKRELRWIVRVRDGFTKRLKEQVTMKKGACDIPVFMDGPYGNPPDITGFDTCVFVAGGSGVAYTISRLRELLTQISKRDACARSVYFIWAIRHAEHMNWIIKDLAKSVSAVTPDVELHIQVYITEEGTPAHHDKLAYITSPTASTRTMPTAPPVDTESRTVRPHSAKTVSDDDVDKSSTASGTAPFDPECVKGVEVSYGRPDVHALLEDIVTSAAGPVSVDLSGPESLVAAVRSALSSPFAGPMNVLRGSASVQLNVEDFTM